MPAPYRQEFSDDIVAVARGREPGLTLKQIPDDFEISEASLENWLKAADVEVGRRPGVTSEEAAELREPKRGTKLPGAGERGLAPGCSLSLEPEAEYSAKRCFRRGRRPHRSCGSWPMTGCPSRLRVGSSSSPFSPTTVAR